LEFERLNRRINPKKSVKPRQEFSESGRFLRKLHRKLYLAEEAKPKINSAVSSPQHLQPKFVPSLVLIKSLKGFSSGNVSAPKANLAHSEDKLKKLLISDGLMHDNGFLNKRYIMRLSQLISTSTASSPAKAATTPSLKRKSLIF
jgi:hypothetical protein